jgi:hypothetical protein
MRTRAEGKYGTSSCYVYVDDVHVPTIQPTPPFVVFPLTGGPETGVHCPLLPPRS